MNACALLFAAITLLSVEKGGVSLTVEGESRSIDPSRSVFVTLRVKSPQSVSVSMPDLRSRVRGFSVAEDFEEPAAVAADGSRVETVNWRFVPEPCADEYRIAPFVVGVSGGRDFYAGPVRFEKPAPQLADELPLEINPERDLPPFGWRLVGVIALIAVALVALVAAAACLLRFVVRKVREHRMSPIERAWVELDRLLKRGLPGRGRYKDFYVELTMVVRRYVARRYGIAAPHLTTEEFFATVARRASAEASLATFSEGAASLRAFLEAADLVKFAGVEATPEMADDATESARGYLRGDSAAAPEGSKK